MTDRGGMFGERNTEPDVTPGSTSPKPSPGSSVQVEELRVSAINPFDSESESEDRTRMFEEKERAEAGSPKLARRPSRRDFIDLPAGSVVGEYEIERKLGQGGMGVVYSAVHPILGKRAAIKVISDEMSRDADSIARFRREARAVAQLASPHIVDVFGFGALADGRAYFVMEHLMGESLHDRIGRGRVPLDEALELLDQVARGLEVAHEAGIVHRDLKPENIFIERRRNVPPVVKLLDFGIVKLANHDDGIAMTQTGVLIGTPVYVAPEQIKSAGSVDHRADIYALGGVAFEMILGRVPFERKTVAELVGAHLECAAPQPRTLWKAVPNALDVMLTAMLAKDPAKRPTLGHVQETIERLRRSAFANPASSIREFTSEPAMKPAIVAPMLAPTSRVAPTPIPSVPPRSRTRLVAAIAGALGVGIVVFSLASGESEHPDRGVGRQPTVVAIDSGVTVSPIEVVPLPAETRADAAIAPAAVSPAAIAPHQAAAPPIARPDAPPPTIVQPATQVPVEADPQPPPVTTTPPRVPKPPRSPTKTPIDRNQTINPFAPKPTTK